MNTNTTNIKTSPLFIIAAVATIGASVAMLATPRPELALVPGLVMLFIYFVSRNMELGYMAIVFLLPFAAYRNIAGAEYLRLHWILAFCLIIFLGLRMVVEKGRPLGLRSSLWPWLLPYFSVSLVTALYSDYPQLAMKNVVLQAVSYVFIALGIILVSRRGFAHTLPRVLVASISIGSLFAALGFYLNIPWFAEKVDGGGFKRGLGVTTDPNSLSLMILFVTPFLARMLIWLKKKRYRLLALCLICINMLALVTTYSRGGVLLLTVLCLGIAATYIHLLSPRYLGLILALAGFLVVGALAVIPQSYWERQASLYTPGEKDLSLKRRFSYLIVGWERFVDSPILGSGPGVFKKYYADHEVADRFVREGKNRERPAHNTYLEVLVGGGLVSLFLFVGAMLQGVVNYTRAIRNFKANGEQEMAVLAQTYRLSYVSLLLFLLLFSDLFQKYLLVSLAMSQVALNLSQDGQVNGR